MNLPDITAAPNVTEYLRALSYPGRVLIVARTTDGVLSVVYAITGRSESSRDRKLFYDTDKSVVVTAKNGSSTDSLRHYRPIVQSPHRFFVGNGTHVDVLAGRVAQGLSPAEAMQNLEYEPDPPILTPRISAFIDQEGVVLVGTAYAPVDGAKTAESQMIHTSHLQPGSAFLLTTYRGTVEKVDVNRDITRATTDVEHLEELTEDVWHALDPQVRVAAVGMKHQQHGEPIIYHA